MIWDTTTLLMVDPTLVDQEENCSLVREEAFRYQGNPLLRVDDKALNPKGQATNLQAKMFVQEGGRYRMWYRPWMPDNPAHVEFTRPIAYAESDDGLKFKPVRLNQVSYKGSKANNFIDADGNGDAFQSVSGMLHDPLDKAYPYKGVYYRVLPGTELEPALLSRFPGLAKGTYPFPWGIGRSRDGLVWEPPKPRDTPLIRASIEGARLHRAMDGGLVIANQMTTPMFETGGRHVKGWISYDEGETADRIPDHLFSLPQHMCRSDISQNGALMWDRQVWVQPHVGLVPIRKGPSMVALHGYLYGAVGAETYAQTADIGLAVSSTGIGFREVWPFRPFIQRGHRGEWDFGLIRQDSIIDTDEQTRFYYTGNEVGNFNGTYQAGMAYIPRDRYAYRLIRGYRDNKPRDRQATFSLKPFTLPDKPKLAANLSQVSKHRHVIFELADAKGKPIPGYRFKDCQPVTREGIRRPIKWKDNRNGKELAGQTVVFRVKIASKNCGSVYSDSPRLYAIYTA